MTNDRSLSIGRGIFKGLQSNPHFFPNPALTVGQGDLRLHLAQTPKRFDLKKEATAAISVWRSRSAGRCDQDLHTEIAAEASFFFVLPLKGGGGERCICMALWKGRYSLRCCRDSFTAPGFFFFFGEGGGGMCCCTCKVFRSKLSCNLPLGTKPACRLLPTPAVGLRPCQRAMEVVRQSSSDRGASDIAKHHTALLSGQYTEVTGLLRWARDGGSAQRNFFWGFYRHAPGCRSLVVVRMTLNPLDPRHNYQ